MNANRMFAWVGKKGLSSILVTSALIMALTLGGFAVSVFGQPMCGPFCQINLSACLQAANGDPAQEAICEDAYDECMNGCLLQ